MARRIERTTALLRWGDLSVTEACFAVGCASRGTFASRLHRAGRHAARDLPASGGRRAWRSKSQDWSGIEKPRLPRSP
ncbi:hypothetical protein [Streptomyces kutzneri]|uniref:hypothetical protein n=1 Tax=Streptomyces kutzneri TaxID=3051179 RepID=UPI003F9A124A